MFCMRMTNIILMSLNFTYSKKNNSQPIACKDKRVLVDKDKNIYQHAMYQGDIKNTPDGSETLLQLFVNICETKKDDNYLGTIKEIEDEFDLVNNEKGKNKYKLVWQTYGEVFEKVQKLSAFFNKVTVRKDIIGIFSVNRYEWIVSEYAGYMSGCINCPLYSTFGPDAILLVLNETEMKICCVSNQKGKDLYEILKQEKIIHLKHIVLFDNDDTNDELVSKYKSIGITVHQFDKILETADLQDLRTSNLTHDDLATICYTSGTTSDPKGVMLSHKNFISTVSAFIKGSKNGEMFNITNDEVYLSYLPLAHVMERVCVTVILSFGASIGFYRGDIKTIKEDYMMIKPTFIAAVPRVLNLFKEKIEANVNSLPPYKIRLFKLALMYKIWRQRKGVFECSSLDSLIFNKVRQEFGGRIRGILCGAAAVSPDVIAFLQGTLCAHIFQGYGQTETTGAVTLKPMNHFNFDTVGIPFPATQIKLVPAKNYGEDCGEVYVRGSNVTSGYYKRPDKTKELFDEDGWAATGDIAKVENGYFKIVGRVKEMFKNSCGEFIVPEKIENLFINNNIHDMFVSKHLCNDKIIAIVVCNDKSLTDDDIHNEIKKRATELLKENKIVGFEIPKHLIILRNAFETFANGKLLTPTAKKKRNAIEEHFKDEISKKQKQVK